MSFYEPNLVTTMLQYDKDDGNLMIIRHLSVIYYIWYLHNF